NIISPMLSFFPLIITFIQKYDKKAGIGTIVSTMLPYTIAFITIWTFLMIIWYVLYLPLGPGAEIFYWG
ncbi:MAG: AbgT family transporter, partial [Bacteroidota bacterium]|nr:AbgT family transporter [Bacteroidota bacterium]